MNKMTAREGRSYGRANIIKTHESVTYLKEFTDSLTTFNKWAQLKIKI